MNTRHHRLVLYTKDVMTIIGCSNRTARRRLAQIRKACNKPKGAYVSIEEFCAFTGLREEKVAPLLT